MSKDTAKGSVHNRAKDFQRTLTAAEYTEDYAYRFSQNALTILIHFLAPARNAELNGEVFDLDIDVLRIVAEYFHHQLKHEIAVGNSHYRRNGVTFGGFHPHCQSSEFVYNRSSFVDAALALKDFVNYLR